MPVLTSQRCQDVLPLTQELENRMHRKRCRWSSVRAPEATRLSISSGPHLPGFIYKGNLRH